MGLMSSRLAHSIMIGSPRLDSAVTIGCFMIYPPMALLIVCEGNRLQSSYSGACTRYNS